MGPKMKHDRRRTIGLYGCSDCKYKYEEENEDDHGRKYMDWFCKKYEKFVGAMNLSHCQRRLMVFNGGGEMCSHYDPKETSEEKKA